MTRVSYIGKEEVYNKALNRWILHLHDDRFQKSAGGKQKKVLKKWGNAQESYEKKIGISMASEAEFLLQNDLKFFQLVNLTLAVEESAGLLYPKVSLQAWDTNVKLKKIFKLTYFTW